MIETRCEIDGSLSQPLEDFFCELVRSPWLIFHEKAGQPHVLMGYFDSEAEALDAWADLRKAFKMLPERPVVGTLEDRDWKEIGDNIRVCFQKHKSEREAKEYAVRYIKPKGKQGVGVE